jgi:hypothetical protein
MDVRDSLDFRDSKAVILMEDHRHVVRDQCGWEEGESGEG